MMNKPNSLLKEHKEALPLPKQQNKVLFQNQEVHLQSQNKSSAPDQLTQFEESPWMI
jgi:hypothetical protein